MCRRSATLTQKVPLGTTAILALEFIPMSYRMRYFSVGIYSNVI